MALGKKAKRQAKILEVVQARGFETIETLSSTLEVSDQTIRRDIAELDKSNQARRTHGGVAILNSLSSLEYLGRRSTANPVKERIAETTATLVQDGDCVFLDAGTTCEHVAMALREHQGLRIVTYNLNAAHILKDCEDFLVAVPGGFVRHIDGSIMGDFSDDFIERFNFDTAILSVSGIDENGVTGDDNHWEVANAKAVMQRSATTILAVDSGKFLQTGLVELCHISEIDHLVTDQLPNPQLEKLARASTQVVLA